MITRDAIVFATSGDEDSARARDAVTHLAVRGDMDVHVVLLWEAARHPGAMPPGTYRELAARRLEAERGTLETAGVRVAGVHLLHGPGTSHILRVAAAAGARLIVTGRRAAGPLQRFFYNSVSESVVRRSGIPTLVVRADASPWPPRRLVVGDDGTVETGRAFEAAAWLGALIGSPVSVIQAHRHGADGGHGANGRLSALQAAVGNRMEVVSAEGDPAHLLVEAADGGTAMIVVGRRRPWHVDPAHPERVSTSVLHHFRGSCLIVPRPRRAAVRTSEPAAAAAR